MCVWVVQVQWIGVNVLSVADFAWQVDGFVMREVADDVELADALRGEVELKRVKRHYFERAYAYQVAVTPENINVARRAATWMATYMWRRALFKVQYEGMSVAAVVASIAARKDGFAGGMPVGAVILEEEAIRRWEGGERAYMRSAAGEEGGGAILDLSKEPLFVELNKLMQYTVVEMRVESVAAVYRELSAELGAKPHAADGVNCGRRNAAVALSRGLDEAGMGQMLVKQLMQHQGMQGTECFEAQYDDAPHSVDLGALMMGRTMEKMDALKANLLMTRVPALAKIRTFQDIPKDDPIRMRIYEGSETRRKLRQSVALRKEAVAALAKQGKMEMVATVQKAMAVTRRTLGSLEARLRYETLETKRWHVWEDAYDRFDELSPEELAERCCVNDVSELRLSEVLTKYGCGRDESASLGAGVRKRATLTTDEQLALLAQWRQVGRERAVRSDKKAVRLQLQVKGGVVVATVKPMRVRNHEVGRSVKGRATVASAVAKAKVKGHGVWASKGTFDIECIVDERSVEGLSSVCDEQPQTEYLVRWAGYKRSWEPWRIHGEVGTPIETWEPRQKVVRTEALEKWQSDQRHASTGGDGGSSIGDDEGTEGNGDGTGVDEQASTGLSTATGIDGADAGGAEVAPVSAVAQATRIQLAAEEAAAAAERIAAAAAEAATAAAEAAAAAAEEAATAAAEAASLAKEAATARRSKAIEEMNEEMQSWLCFDSVQVFVRQGPGQTLVFTDVTVTSPVTALKSVVAVRTGVPADDFWLKYGGQCLEDDVAMQLYGIESESTLEMCYRGCGGMLAGNGGGASKSSTDGADAPPRTFHNASLYQVQLDQLYEGGEHRPIDVEAEDWHLHAITDVPSGAGSSGGHGAGSSGGGEGCEDLAYGCASDCGGAPPYPELTESQEELIGTDMSLLNPDKAERYRTEMLGSLASSSPPPRTPSPRIKIEEKETPHMDRAMARLDGVVSQSSDAQSSSGSCGGSSTTRASQKQQGKRPMKRAREVIVLDDSTDEDDTPARLPALAARVQAMPSSGMNSSMLQCDIARLYSKETHEGDNDGAVRLGELESLGGAAAGRANYDKGLVHFGDSPAAGAGDGKQLQARVDAIPLEEVHSVLQRMIACLPSAQQARARQYYVLLDEQQVRALHAAVVVGARLTIISGPAGSGKSALIKLQVLLIDTGVAAPTHGARRAAQEGVDTVLPRASFKPVVEVMTTFTSFGVTFKGDWDVESTVRAIKAQDAKRQKAAAMYQKQVIALDEGGQTYFGQVDFACRVGPRVNGGRQQRWVIYMDGVQTPPVVDKRQRDADPARYMIWDGDLFREAEAADELLLFGLEKNYRATNEKLKTFSTALRDMDFDAAWPLAQEFAKTEVCAASVAASDCLLALITLCVCAPAGAGGRVIC